jgi:3-phosphoshikimate 1-carboxyvinyltransferase
MNFLDLSPKNFLSFKGTITPEKSKSIANRVLLLQALSGNAFSTDFSGNSDDVKLMQAALINNTSVIDAGLAGTVLRFLTAGFSVMPGKHLLTGSERLKQRPLKQLTDSLIQLGAEIQFKGKQGFAPLLISGKKLTGGKIRIDASVSSQFISALMMIGPFLKRGLEIELEGESVSGAYLILTQGIMQQLGFEVKISSNKILIRPGEPKNQVFKIEADWSAAAYWLAFVALTPQSEITLQGLFENSLQGDSGVLPLFREFGVDINWKNGDLVAKHNPSVTLPKSFKYDFTQMPDQAQTFAFLCAALGIEAELTGLQTLKHKETDRIVALQTELEKLGINVQSDSNSIKLNGKITAREAIIKTYDDHRMAMAGALIGTQIPIKIENPDVVSKSYPGFWKDLDSMSN